MLDNTHGFLSVYPLLYNNSNDVIADQSVVNAPNYHCSYYYTIVCEFCVEMALVYLHITVTLAAYETQLW